MLKGGKRGRRAGRRGRRGGGRGGSDDEDDGGGGRGREDEGEDGDGGGARRAAGGGRRGGGRRGRRGRGGAGSGSDNEGGDDDDDSDHDDAGETSLRVRSGVKKPPKSVLRSLQRRRLELGERFPEVHVIGEIVGGSGFGAGVTCKFELDWGDGWECIEGADADGGVSGQTHTDYPIDGTDMAVWAHPIDAHFGTSNVQGWPKILLQVWKLDGDGRMHLEGYGFCHVPTSPGHVEVEVQTWRPLGTHMQEFASFFVGGAPKLKEMDVVFRKAWESRCHLFTASSGAVHLSLDVILKNFADNNVEWA